VNIAIFGLGYVGSVSAACLAAAGHRVIGVDVDGHKLELIRSGKAPVQEPGLDELLERFVSSGQLTVESVTERAVENTQISLVCVGTPSRRNGSLDSTYLERVLQDIGRALARTGAYHVIAIRSTLLPGVLSSRLVPLIERASGGRAGQDFGVCVNPEFLREGSAIKDFQNPPFTVIGADDDRAARVLRQVYGHLDAPVQMMLQDEASLVKYASNAFHALKVSFANEIGALCQSLGVDGRRVMQVFCEDHELNISSKYLRPGFGFGGSCLPKDLRAITYLGKDLDVTTPLLSSVLPSNDAQIQRVVDAVLDQSRRRVGLIGLSFKTNSDDLRESPFVRLAEALIGKGISLRVFDPDVAIGKVFGRNRAYVEERLPHVAQLFVDGLPDVAAASDILIVGKRVPGIEAIKTLRTPDHLVIDLAGIDDIGDCYRPWSGVSVPPASSQTPVS
jgi:GDP-mannose 6-dehydrogenase